MESKLVVRLFGKPIALTGLLLLAGLAAACGGGGEKEATPSATGTPAASPSATAAAAIGEVPGVTPTEIILGQHATLSGGLAAAYKLVTDAQLAYLRYVNEELGGVCGRKIVLIRYDDYDTEDAALAAVRKLVEEDKVLAVVGSLGPEMAAYEYLNGKGVPDLLVINMADKIARDPQGYPWVTQMVPSLYVESGNFAQYLRQNHPGKKVALLYSNTEQGNDQLRGLREFLDPSNELVAAQSYELTALDIRSQMLNLEKSGAEVVVLSTSIPFTAQALKQADRMGWHPHFLATYGNADPLLFQFVPGKLAEGLISFHAFKMPDWTDDPAVAKHHEIMAKYGGPPPGIFTILSQVMMEVLVETLRRSCDNLTREGVMAANLSFDHWRSDLLFEGTSISTSQTDHRFLQEGPMQEVVLENGKPKWVIAGGPYSFQD